MNMPAAGLWAISGNTLDFAKKPRKTSEPVAHFAKGTFPFAK